MKENKNIFWVSYSDLMTSLFFIMLVLFVVTVGYLKLKQGDLKKASDENQELADSLRTVNKELIISNEEKTKLLNLDKQFERLTENDNFKQIGEKFYYKELMGKEIFKENTTDFHPDFNISIIDEAGKEIESFLRTLDPSMKYILIIEGNAAKSNKAPNTTPDDSQHGYELSYNRALVIYERWRSQRINLRKSNVEVLICGSGFNGASRDKNEDNNKRIVIQILPKVMYNKQEKR